MTDEHYRAINRALAYVGMPVNVGEDGEDLQDVREAARTALHHIFGREKRLRESRSALEASNVDLIIERDRLREALEDVKNYTTDVRARFIARNALKETT